MVAIIHDPIHNDIFVSELAVKIIDHPYFNRSHFICQTGTAYKVFPSATHTRKSHMIGTYALTHKLLNQLGKFVVINEKEKELIALGALCHDIGHGPGSHAFDKHVITYLIQKGLINDNHPWVTHEQRSIHLFRKIGKFCSKFLSFSCVTIQFGILYYCNNKI